MNLDNRARGLKTLPLEGPGAGRKSAALESWETKRGVTRRRPLTPYSLLNKGRPPSKKKAYSAAVAPALPGNRAMSKVFYLGIWIR